MRTNTSFYWDEDMTRLLSDFFSDGELAEKMKSLKLLKLRDGTLTSTESGPVYFPTKGLVPIPDVLNIRVVSRSASEYPDGGSLYQKLGVSQATVGFIRSLTLVNLQTSKSWKVGDLKSCLHYLYLTHQSLNPKYEQSYDKVQIATADMEIVCPQDNLVYLPGKGYLYSPENLLGLVLPVSKPAIKFLHPTILDNGPNQPSIFHPSWKSWLCDCIGVQDRVNLLKSKSHARSKSNDDDHSNNDENEDLLPSFDYVFNNHPDKFLRLLANLWALEGPQFFSNPGLVSKIRQLNAQNLCGVNYLISLKDTWAPSESLVECVRDYMELPGDFPFLRLGEKKSIDLFLTSRWSFLKMNLGVKHNLGLDFKLAILKSIKRSSAMSALSLRMPQTRKIFALYASISEAFFSYASEEKEQVREFFDDSGVLYIDDTGPLWTGSSSCLWAAPPGMVSAYSLKSLYQKEIWNREEMQSVERLFCNGLNIRDATVKDLIQDLSMLRNERCEDVTRVAVIYKYLDKMSGSPEMRRAFDEAELILVKQDDAWAWFRASDCLWSEVAAFEPYNRLKECYPDLREFFVDKLGIKITAFDELLSPTSHDPDSIKEAILSFMVEVSEMIPDFDFEQIKKAKFFPVRYPNGSVSLCSISTEFAIADREHLRRELQDHVKILDFDLKAICLLEPFFACLDIEDRYLSSCEEEVTIQDSGTLLHQPERWDLRHKAYHIVRVAATFDTYGPYSDAVLLYQRLQTMDVIEVSSMSSELVVIQDGKISRSTPKPAAGHISDDNHNFTIYVPKDKKAQQLCFFSVLPRILVNWLRQDMFPWHAFEMRGSLTSIIAAEISDLDEILEDQGIVKLPFNEHDAASTKVAIEERHDFTLKQEVDGKVLAEDHGKALVLRGREPVIEAGNKDGRL
ncbi:hypothetical protein FBEOM_14248 [Fusarium beomiforme]|uniref:Uncharacterized protein n=1 Tax=Fusarium beomiforme TaxID=44412 RepID=A0A9P5A476_9HYPO|nr:hypothetical protein FBEOM_14248 [Fusarium beomiforme]